MRLVETALRVHHHDDPLGRKTFLVQQPSDDVSRQARSPIRQHDGRHGPSVARTGSGPRHGANVTRRLLGHGTGRPSADDRRRLRGDRSRTEPEGGVDLPGRARRIEGVEVQPRHTRLERAARTARWPAPRPPCARRRRRPARRRRAAGPPSTGGRGGTHGAQAAHVEIEVTGRIPGRTGVSRPAARGRPPAPRTRRPRRRTG